MLSNYNEATVPYIVTKHRSCMKHGQRKITGRTVRPGKIMVDENFYTPVHEVLL